MEALKKWLFNEAGSGYSDGSGYGYGAGDGYGYGSGYSDGSGYGSGSGDGSGSGAGYGYGAGDGYGYGSGYSDGSGYGSGSGDGYGYGAGDGYGSGSGAGYGDGIKMFDGKAVYQVDGIPTIIDKVMLSLAKGYILNNDFTLTPCRIAKENGYFAHGKTCKEAQEALQAKIFENMDTEQTIDKFIETFKKGEKYPGHMFYEWHHYLTGSCKMGRDSFVHNHGINLDDMYTVDEFMELCKNDYGCEIFQQLSDRWNNGII